MSSGRAPLFPVPDGDDWVGLTGDELSLDAAQRWLVLPRCGAVVTFTGTSRDHSGSAGGGDRRDHVTTLEYEAYDDVAVARLHEVAAEVRRRWPDVGRVAVWHRTGEVPVGEASVAIAVSAPHRDDAFAAARFAIDAVKATVPIWKREVWPGGSDWALDAKPIDDLRSFTSGTDS